MYTFPKFFHLQNMNIIIPKTFKKSRKNLEKFHKNFTEYDLIKLIRKCILFRIHLYARPCTEMIDSQKSGQGFGTKPNNDKVTIYTASE